MSVTANLDPRNLCTYREVYMTTNPLDPSTLNTNTYGTYNAIVASEQVSGVAKWEFDSSTYRPGTEEYCGNWRVKYKTKRCRPADTCSLDDPCNAAPRAFNPWKEAEPIMSDPIGDGFKITADQYRCICDGRMDLLRELYMEAYESMMNAVNKRAVEYLLGVFGNYYEKTGDCKNAVNSGVNPRTICLFNENGQPNAMAFTKLTQQFRRMGFDGRPIVIGDTKIDSLMDAQPIYAGNLDGLDLTKGPSVSTIRDYDISKYSGSADECVIAFAPGAIWRMEYFQYDQNGAYEDSTHTRKTFDLGAFLGKPSFIVDEVINIEKCKKEISMTVNLCKAIDFCHIWDEAFSADCGQCWNYILKFLVDCCDMTCLDFDC